MHAVRTYNENNDAIHSHYRKSVMSITDLPCISWYVAGSQVAGRLQNAKTTDKGGRGRFQMQGDIILADVLRS